MTLSRFVSMRPPLVLDNDLCNKEVSIVYYWFHHMLPSNVQDAIQRVIDDADYDLFKNWCNKLNRPDICYLPDRAYVYCGDDFIGWLPMGPQTLYEITFSECECG